MYPDTYGPSTATLPRHRPGEYVDRLVRSSAELWAAEYRGRVRVYRANLAGAGAAEAADQLQTWIETGATKILDGSVSSAYGVGAWGLEPGFVVETASPKPGAFLDLVVQLLREYDQECAYVTVDGSAAYEVDRAGEVSPITGA